MVGFPPHPQYLGSISRGVETSQAKKGLDNLSEERLPVAKWVIILLAIIMYRILCMKLENSKKLIIKITEYLQL